jgi:hypothetical protein
MTQEEFDAFMRLRHEHMKLKFVRTHTEDACVYCKTKPPNQAAGWVEWKEMGIHMNPICVSCQQVLVDKLNEGRKP